MIKKFKNAQFLGASIYKSAMMQGGKKREKIHNFGGYNLQITHDAEKAHTNEGFN